MAPFVECTETLVIEFVTTVAGDLYRATLTCALGMAHEDKYHWDERGFYWLPYQPPPVAIGSVHEGAVELAGAGAAGGLA